MIKIIKMIKMVKIIFNTILETFKKINNKLTYLNNKKYYKNFNLSYNIIMQKKCMN